MAAREDLAGRALIYRTAEGSARIEVDGETTRVSGDGVESGEFQTFATRLADDLYFISWGSENGGSHLIFNTSEKKVYDHLLPDGTRQEQIFAITCFDTIEACG